MPAIAKCASDGRSVEGTEDGVRLAAQCGTVLEGSMRTRFMSWRVSWSGPTPRHYPASSIAAIEAPPLSTCSPDKEARGWPAREMTSEWCDLWGELTWRATRKPRRLGVSVSVGAFSLFLELGLFLFLFSLIASLNFPFSIFLLSFRGKIGSYFLGDWFLEQKIEIGGNGRRWVELWSLLLLLLWGIFSMGGIVLLLPVTKWSVHLSDLSIHSPAHD